MTPEGIEALWRDQLWTAWVLAKGQRAAELRGDRRAKLLDGTGLHPYSVCWGQVYAYEDLLPPLAARRDDNGHAWTVIRQEPAAAGALDPVSMRARAYRVAEEQFAAAVRAGDADLWAHTPG